MKQEDAEEFTQAIGQVASGAYRQIALAQKLGVPKALGLSTEEWVKSRLGGYVRLGIEERRRAAVELKADGHSQRQIGAALGVHESTVRDDMRDSPRSHKKKPHSSVVEAGNPAPDDIDDAVAKDPAVKWAKLWADITSLIASVRRNGVENLKVVWKKGGMGGTNQQIKEIRRVIRELQSILKEIET